MEIEASALLRQCSPESLAELTTTSPAVKDPTSDRLKQNLWDSGHGIWTFSKYSKVAGSETFETKQKQHCLRAEHKTHNPRV